MYGEAINTKNKQSKDSRKPIDNVMISLWSEDDKGHLYSGTPINAKNVIRRNINDDKAANQDDIEQVIFTGQEDQAFFFNKTDSGSIQLNIINMEVSKKELKKS